MSFTLITGASHGLGKGLAYKLAKEKHRLMLVARDENALKDLLSHLSKLTEVLIYPLDLCKSKDRSTLINEIHEKKPTLVINNAGAGLYGMALIHPTDILLDLIELNVTALTEITLEAARVMALHQLPGTILNISSAAAFFPMPEFAIYAASKAYVKNFSLALHEEFKPYSINILTACPGQIATSFKTKASQGFRTANDRFTLDEQTAVDSLLKQIETKKILNIFPFSYKVGIVLFHLIPKYFLFHLFISKIKKYYRSKDIDPLKRPYERS